MIQLGMLLFFFCEDLLWICYTAELGCIVAGERFHDDTIKPGKITAAQPFLKTFQANIAFPVCYFFPFIFDS